MDLWHHVVEVWEYLIEHSALLAGQIFGFDPKLYVPWAQLAAALLAIVLSSWGLLNVWNHFDSRRRALLVGFLIAEEKRILELKRNLAERFHQRKESTEVSEPLDVHAKLNSALGFFDAGKILRAERELSELQGLLEERRDIASRQSELALKQTGAAHLFLGSIAASQGNSHKAVSEFGKAIGCNDKDLDARKYLVEQMLVLSDKEPMSQVSHLDRALSEVDQMIARTEPGQLDYLADAYRLKGTAYLQRNNNGNARDALATAGRGPHRGRTLRLGCNQDLESASFGHRQQARLIEADIREAVKANLLPGVVIYGEGGNA